MKGVGKTGCIGSIIGGTLLLLALAMAVETTGGKPPLFTMLLESFEGADLGDFGPVTDASYKEKRYAQKVERSPRYASTEGEHSLQGTFNVLLPNGAAIFQTERPQDLRGTSALMFDIYVSEPNLRVALAVSTGIDWEWHESEAVSLAMGWTKVTIPLDRGFKTERSQWRHTQSVANLSDVRRISIIIFPGRQLQGTIFLDNLRAAKAVP